MELPDIERFPRETLAELAEVYAKNWQTLDGLWFGNVEAECGLETAVRIDLKNWEKMAALEAQRIKKVLKLNEGGLGSILKVLSLMSWQIVSPRFQIEEESPTRIVFRYPHCTVQEGRQKNAKPEFPCKTMKLTLLSSLARVVEPKARVKCLACPPDPHPAEFWCKWELTMAEE